MILSPGLELTLRPMKYPLFYEMYLNGIRNTWTVDEVDFSSDVIDLNSNKISQAERFLIHRLVAFFATGDCIVGNNATLNYYRHINSPEARMYISRLIFEESLHVQFYLTLLDTYLPEDEERNAAFSAVHNIPTIKSKADFATKWMKLVQNNSELKTVEDRRQFLLNMVCFASCIEGLFFFGAFAYVYFLRSKGLLNGLATGTNWVFRDESCHIQFAHSVIDIVKKEEPSLWNSQMQGLIKVMLNDAIECEMDFAKEFLDHGIAGLSERDMRTYLRHIADMHMQKLGIPKQYNVRNPFGFMELQDMQELTNFFERRVSAYQMGVSGDVSFCESF